MMTRSLDFEPGDVIVVPFPFTERTASKRRPALVCSTREFNEGSEHLVLAMITSSAHQSWPHDVPVSDRKAAGLPATSIVRWKLFTLPRSFVLKRVGRLSRRDRSECARLMPVGIE